MFAKGQRLGPGDLTQHLSAWIDPQGRIFYTGECGHGETAEILGSTIDRLERIGWMHLSYGSTYMESYPSQAQIDTLFDISQKSIVERGLTGYYVDNFKEMLRDLLRQ